MYVCIHIHMNVGKRYAERGLLGDNEKKEEGMRRWESKREKEKRWERTATEDLMCVYVCKSILGENYVKEMGNREERGARGRGEKRGEDDYEVGG